MSEWFDNQKKPSFDWRKKVGALIQAKTAELRKLTEGEKHRLENLQGMLQQLKRANTFCSLFRRFNFDLLTPTKRVAQCVTTKHVDY